MRPLGPVRKHGRPALTCFCLTVQAEQPMSSATCFTSIASPKNSMTSSFLLRAMLRALAALGDWPLTQVFACGFRIPRNPTLCSKSPSALAPRIESSLHFNAPAPHPLISLSFHTSLMSLLSEHPLDRFADKAWEHHPNQEQKT